MDAGWCGPSQNGPELSASAQGYQRRQVRRLYAGNLADALGELLISGARGRRRLRGGRGKSNFEGDDVLRFEARVHGPQVMDRAKEQSGARQQDQRECDLRDCENTLRALMARQSNRGRASFRSACRSASACFSAGTRPNNIPTAIEAPSANKRTEAFTPIFSVRGRLPGTAASTAVRPHFATASPRTPPANDRSTLSVINCWTICMRLAPSARRTANSRVRAAERASNRLATFAQAMSKTRPTAPSSKQKRSAYIADKLLFQRNDRRSQPFFCGGVQFIDMLLQRVHFRLCLTNADSRSQARNTEDVVNRTIAEEKRIGAADRRCRHRQAWSSKRNLGGRTPVTV